MAGCRGALARLNADPAPRGAARPSGQSPAGLHPHLCLVGWLALGERGPAPARALGPRTRHALTRRLGPDLPAFPSRRRLPKTPAPLTPGPGEAGRGTRGAPEEKPGKPDSQRSVWTWNWVPAHTASTAPTGSGPDPGLGLGSRPGLSSGPSHSNPELLSPLQRACRLSPPPRRPPHKPPPLGLMEPWSVAHGLPPTQLYPMLSPTPCLTLAADSPGGLPPSPGQQDRWDRPAEDALAVAGVSEPGDCPPRHTRPLTATTLKEALGCSGEQCPCVQTRGRHTSPSRAPQRHGEPGPPPHVLTRAPALPGHRGPPQKPQSFAERPGHVRIVWPLLSHFCLPTSGVLRTAPTASVL